MSDLPPLAYSRPRDLDAALAALARRGAWVYAGGTDLLVALTERRPWVRSVRELIDIKELDEAKGIRDLGAQLRIGSLTTADQLASSAQVRRHAQALAEAAERTSSPPLRRRGTLGGNLVTPHPAGDVTTALLALDALVELAEGGAVRTVPVAEFISSRVGRTARRRLILAVRLRKWRRSAFEKLGGRRGFSRSIVAVAVAFRGRETRVAIGGMAKRPFLAEEYSQLKDSVVAPDACLRLAEVLVERARARAARA